MIPAWVALYTNPPIPYREANCWELVARALREQASLKVANFYDEYDREEDALWEANERPKVDAIVRRELASGRWEKVERPQLFDVALYRIGGLLCHVGVVLDSRHGLTTDRRRGSHWYRLGMQPWSNLILDAEPRGAGYYRHVCG